MDASIQYEAFLKLETGSHTADPPIAGHPGWKIIDHLGR